jgi:hypothetical protein
VKGVDALSAVEVLVRVPRQLSALGHMPQQLAPQGPLLSLFCCPRSVGKVAATSCLGRQSALLSCLYLFLTWGQGSNTSHPVVVGGPLEQLRCGLCMTCGVHGVIQIW